MELESIRSNILEKLVHAFIGGIVAVALVVFHEGLKEATGLGEIAFRFVVFLAVFIVLAALELLLEWAFARPKIRLPAAGVIDGVWLHARYLASTGEMAGGSVVHVRTRRPNRFHVRGKSYLPNGDYDGSFEGNGVRDRDNAFVYSYHGEQEHGQGPTREGSGTGQYFYKKPQGEQFVEGSFSAHGLTRTQFVIGKRHGSRIDERGQLAILKAYLQSEAPGQVTPET